MQLVLQAWKLPVQCKSSTTASYHPDLVHAHQEVFDQIGFQEKMDPCQSPIEQKQYLVEWL